MCNKKTYFFAADRLAMEFGLAHVRPSLVFVQPNAVLISERAQCDRCPCMSVVYFYSVSCC